MKWEGKMRERNIGEDERACDLPGKVYKQCTIQDFQEPISSTNDREMRVGREKKGLEGKGIE